MKSKEIINRDEKFLIPEARSTNHWRNASTAFQGTKFWNLSNKNTQKKKLRTKSLKKKRNCLQVKIKRCKSSPLPADHQLLKTLKPKALQRSSTSTLQPRRLQFGNEQSKKAKIGELKIKTPKTFVSEKPKQVAIVTVDLQDDRNEFQSLCMKDSAPAKQNDELDAKKQSCNTVKSKLIAKRMDVHNALNKIPKKNIETIQDGSSPVIEFENGRSLPSYEPESLADSGTKSVPNKLTCADELETTSATLNKDSIANNSSLKATKTNMQDVQNCKLLEGNANGASAVFPVSVGKSVNDGSVIEADINHDINLTPDVYEKLTALDPHIQQSCAPIPVNKLESRKQGKLTKLKVHAQPVKLRGVNKKSDSEAEPKLQHDQSKEKDLDDKPEDMVTAGTVKLSSAKHELKREHSLQPCLISSVIDHRVNEASDQTLQNNLPSFDKPLADVCKTKEGSTLCEVQQHSKENTSKVGSVIAKKNVINSSNKTQTFETAPRVLATPQRNKVKDEHPREIIPADGSNMKKIMKTPSEKKPLGRGFETPNQKSNIAGTDQICESLSKSASKSANKLVENGTSNDELREIQNKKECNIKNRGDTLDKSNANKHLYNIAERTPGENWSNEEDRILDDGPVERASRHVTSNERSPSELTKQIKENECEKNAAATAAEEAVNDHRLDQSVSHHSVSRGGI